MGDAQGSQRIQSLLFEGVMAWQQGIIDEEQDLEASFLDSHQNDNLVGREMCTRIALVVSVPHDVGLQILKGPHDLVDADGNLTESWSKVFDEFYDRCRTIEEDNELAFQDDPLHKAHERMLDASAAEALLFETEITHDANLLLGTMFFPVSAQVRRVVLALPLHARAT
jgi:hypothetical protein